MIRALVLLALAAAPFPASAARTHPGWMIGTWARVDEPRSLRDQACPEAEIYDRRGIVTYRNVGDPDRWLIDGNRLIRRPVSGRGPTLAQTFRRVRPYELVFHGQGYTQWLIRCSPASTP